MGERFLGLKEYRPCHVETRAALPEDDLAALRSLQGRSLRRSLAVWEATEDAWFKDAPLILEFTETQLEIAAFKFHLLLSWNSIDVAGDIVWYEGSTFQLEWRENAIAELDPLLDQPLQEINLVEYRGGLNGIAFRTQSAYAEIFNALDELGVQDAPEQDPEVIRTPI